MLEMPRLLAKRGFLVVFAIVVRRRAGDRSIHIIDGRAPEGQRIPETRPRPEDAPASRTMDPELANEIASLPPAWIWIMLGLVGCVASVTDIRETRIPNWLTIPLVLAGLIHAPIAGGWDGIGDALLGMLAASALFIWAYAFHGGGAGDAKLMMGIGLWLGLDASIVVTLAVTIVGFVIAMIGVAVRGRLGDIPIVVVTGWLRTAQSMRRLLSGKPIERTESEIEAGRIKGGQRPEGWIPFAPAILGGTLLGWWYLEAYGTLL